MVVLAPKFHLQYGHMTYNYCLESAAEPERAESAIPTGCYSTHILLSKGTTIVRLVGGDHCISRENTCLPIWPTFNCAFATMVHAGEKVKLHLPLPDDVTAETSGMKCALLLVGFVNI